MPNTPILSPEQANPFMHGLRQGTMTIGQMLQNQQQQIQNRNLPQMLDEQLLQQRLSNQINAPKAQYAPQMTLADLAKSQAEVPEMQARASLLGQQAKWFGPTAQADIGYKQQQTAQMPTETQAKLLSAQARQGMSNYYNNPATQVARVLNNPALQSLIASNPEVRKNVGTILSSATQRGADMSTVGGQQRKAPALTENDYEDLRTNISDALTKKTSTSQIINQRHYASILDSLLDQGNELMPSVAQYAGLANMGKKGADALASSFGKTSKQYGDYMMFTRTVAPLSANEMRRTLGAQASDKESELLKQVGNPGYWDSNPEQALAQYQYLTDLYKNNINKRLAKSPTQTLAELKAGYSNNPSRQQQMEQPVIKSLNGRNYIKRNGQWYPQ